VTAKIIDGKMRAKEVREGLKNEVLALKSSGTIPKLSVILVGEDPASHIYVSNKEKACSEVGIASEIHRLPSNTREIDLMKLVAKLNDDKNVHGILVQLPLPDQISEENILNSILPNKDVDGLGAQNMGMLVKGEGDPFIPCTPQGIIDLIKTTGIEIKGKNAIVVGRSNIVGKPAAILLLGQHATVTICHSRTLNLKEIISKADILVAAIGKPRLITGDMIKEGAAVIDVGTTRTAKGWEGDVDFDSAKEKAGYLTPVPGGVGPMTIAMLLKNTIKAASKK